MNCNLLLCIVVIIITVVVVNMTVCEVSFAHFVSKIFNGTEKSRTQLEQMSFNDGKPSYR